MSGNWRADNSEPALDEVFADSIVLMLMERDGLDAADVRRFIEEQKKKLRPPKMDAA